MSNRAVLERLLDAHASMISLPVPRSVNIRESSCCLRWYS